MAVVPWWPDCSEVPLVPELWTLVSFVHPEVIPEVVLEALPYPIIATAHSEAWASIPVDTLGELLLPSALPCWSSGELTIPPTS